MKLSIVIPVYNAENYLHQCLDSVLTQSLQDIEVICVDDGSTDRSLEILREYEERDVRVRVLCQQNRYAGVARNNGMSVARGEYVAFLDADDYVLDYAYESLYLRAVEYGLDWVKCRSIPYDVERCMTLENPNYLLRNVKPGDFHRILTPEDEGQVYRISVVPWNGIYRRAFLEEHGISFNSLMCINDRSFYWRVLTNAQRFMLAKDYLVVHRVGQNESLVGKRAKHFDCQFRSFEITAGQLAEDGIPEEKARRVIDRELSDLRTWYRRFCMDPQYGEEIQAKTAAFAEAYDGPYQDMLEDMYQNHMPSLEKAKNAQADLPAFRFFREACEQPKVTVVIPVYNVQEYLHECLDSVCAQTLEELEIICVDDGSTDASALILREYAQVDKRIRILTQQNRYAGAARNAGIREARGEYLLFLDSDDFFEKRLCELTYQQASSRNADIVLFGAKNYDMATQTVIENPAYFRRELLPQAEVFSRREIPDTLLLLTTPNPWLKLFRREFVLQEGIFYQEIRHSNDIYFNIVAMAIAERITYIKKNLVCYRKGREGNLQSTKDDNPTLFLDAYEEARRELVQRGIYEEVEKGFAERFFASCVHNLSTVNTSKAWEEICVRLFDSEIVAQGFRPLEEYQIPENVRRILLARQIMECCGRMRTDDQYASADLKGLYDYVLEELRADRVAQRKLQKQLNEANRKIRRKDEELKDIKGSVAFRIGKGIMWLPKKLRGWVKR